MSRKNLGELYNILKGYLTKYSELHPERVISRGNIMGVIGKLFHVKGKECRNIIFNELEQQGYIVLYCKRRDGVLYKVME